MKWEDQKLGCYKLTLDDRVHILEVGIPTLVERIQKLEKQVKKLVKKPIPRKAGR